MKFKLIEKERKGFARYCPTFAKAYDCMREGLRKRSDARKIRKLARKLSDEDHKVREEAAWDLDLAVERGTNITAVMPALMKSLGDEDEDVRSGAAHALGNAARKGADITAAIPALLKALCDGNTAWALGNAGNYKDQKTRTLIVNEIIGFMRSDWFQSEMWKNSVRYEAIATEIAQILDKMREAEKKAA